MNINNIINEIVNNQNAYIESQIKEKAMQGYKYILIHIKTTFEGDAAETKAKMNITCQGINGIDEIPEGYKGEVYDLSKVREYMGID